MKATFKFDLPEEDREFKIFSQAQRAQSALWDISQKLRSWRKYHNDFVDADDALDKIINEFYKIINEHNIDIDL